MVEKKKSDIVNSAEKMDIMLILEKMLEIEKEKNKVGIFKKVVSVIGVIGATMIIGLLCYRLVKTDFSFESILSTLLAFFSIFISIFFYFKADETSTAFYKSSYEFMKDISVTLGKIEERFGEKLNSLNDKISHLDNLSNEKTEEIQEQKDDKDKIINDLMDKANLDEKEKEKFRRQLAEKEHQIEKLKNEQLEARRESAFLRKRWQQINDSLEWEPSTGVLLTLLSGDKNDIEPILLRRLNRYGYINEEGVINEQKIIDTLDKRNRIR